ncbi:hypothetical protein [Novosphingobium sp. AAP83]|nr:hypothetical protein [Novosphingobium sp. AAP83]
MEPLGLTLARFAACAAQSQRSLPLEFAFGICVVGIVAWLGVLDPAA